MGWKTGFNPVLAYGSKVIKKTPETAKPNRELLFSYLKLCKFLSPVVIGVRVNLNNRKSEGNALIFGS